MTKKIVIIILALASFISVDAQTLTKEQLLLTLNEMQVEITKLISRLHDGHTNVGYPEMPGKVESGWVPLKFKVTPDGLIVNLWRQDLEPLKGARLLAIA